MTSYKALIILAVIFDIILCCIGALEEPSAEDMIELSAEDMIKCENILTQIGFKSETGFYNLMFVRQFDTYDKFKKQVEDTMEINVTQLDFFNKLYVAMEKEEIKSDIVYTPEKYCTNSLNTFMNDMRNKSIPESNPWKKELNQLREEQKKWINQLIIKVKDMMTKANDKMIKLINKVKTEIFTLDQLKGEGPELQTEITNMNQSKDNDLNDEQRKFLIFVEKWGEESKDKMLIENGEVYLHITQFVIEILRRDKIFNIFAKKKNKECTDEILEFKYDETGIKDTVLRYEKDNPFKNHITSYIISVFKKVQDLCCCNKTIDVFQKLLGNPILKNMKKKKFQLQYFNYHKDIYEKHSTHYTKFLPSNICKNKQMPQMPKALLNSGNITEKEK